MEFFIDTSVKGRLGQLILPLIEDPEKEFLNDNYKGANEQPALRPKLKPLIMETPCCMLYTRYGHIPHLTHDVADYLSTVPNLKRLRLCELMEESVETSLKSSTKDYRHFTNSKSDAVFFCLIQDVMSLSRKNIHIYTEERSISVWTQSGRRKVTVNEYMNAVEQSGIKWVEALCDVVPGGETTKRCRKSVDRTLSYLKQCTDRMKSNPEHFDQLSLFGAIVGGDCVKERLRSAKETAKFNVSGFVLEGFDQIGDQWLNILKLTLDHLPGRKMRILPGLFSPDQIIDAVSSGIDVVDSSYVYGITERGLAAVFEYRCKKVKTGAAFCIDDNSRRLPSDQLEFEIDLNDCRFSKDFRPLLTDCSCYTCVNYTRVYVHHLLIANEMLARVLLMIHNMHHFIGFMSEVRSAVDHGTLNDVRTELLRTKP